MITNIRFISRMSPNPKFLCRLRLPRNIPLTAFAHNARIEWHTARALMLTTRIACRDQETIFCARNRCRSARRFKITQAC
jgi:hypothetical protein